MAKSTDAPEQLRPYHFHGASINAHPTQATGDCPFCDAEGKFSVKTETGQYRCLRCEDTGNAYSFLFRLHQLSTENTSEKDYSQLSKSRGVSPVSLRFFGICKSRLTGEWIVPGYNTKGNLANLYRLIKRKDEQGVDRFVLMSTPNCKPQPFGTADLINHPRKVVWVTEGVWDGCALFDALHAPNKPADPSTGDDFHHSILPVPGCGNFNADWLELLAGKEARVCFDNDHPKIYGPDHEKAGEQIIKRDGTPTRPGWDGMERIVSLVEKSNHKPKPLKVLFWNGMDGIPADADIPQGHNPNLADGYDLRDLFRDRGHAEGLRLLLTNLQTVKLSSPKKRPTNKQGKEDVPAIEPLDRTTFNELCDNWSAVLHFTQQLRDTLAIMLSVVLSTEAEKVNHLWLRVIGPPGSGKSTLAEAISVAREWVSPKSIITGFHSGFIDQNSDEPGSASLIPELDNKTVVMKDGDTLANSPNRDRILSELRDLYDGTSRAHYRTGQQDEFEDVRLSFILCGTDELRQLNRTFLGERFLDCEIMARGEDHTPYLQRASSNTYASLAGFISPKEEGGADSVPQDRMMFLKQATYGFIKYLKENYRTFPVPLINATTLERLQAMGQYVALMRARVRHDHNEGSFRPRAELPTRLTSQFTKMAFFAALVLRKPEIDDEVLRLVLKVVHDTSIGLQQEISEGIAKNIPNGGGTTARQLSLTLNIPETTIRRQLADMRQFGIVQPYAEANNSGQRGRDRHCWQLTPPMLELWDKVFLLPPKEERPNVSPKPKERRIGGDRKQHHNNSGGDSGRQGKVGGVSPKRSPRPSPRGVRRNPKK